LPAPLPPGEIAQVTVAALENGVLIAQEAT
jgi:hypothetical protein